MNDDFDQDRIPTIPEVDSADVEQEYQLMMLEYKNNPLTGAETPSRAIVYRRLKSHLREYNISEIPSGAVPIGDDGDILDNRLDATMQLIEWSFTQSDEVQNIVVDFLQEPTDHMYKITYNRLLKLGVLAVDAQQEPVIKERGTLADVLKRQLSSVGTMQMSELYEIARNVHVAKRPHAAVRQTIRRFVENGLCIRDDDTVIWKGN